MKAVTFQNFNESSVMGLTCHCDTLSLPSRLNAIKLQFAFGVRATSRRELHYHFFEHLKEVDPEVNVENSMS
jgi:hypothetical protein